SANKKDNDPPAAGLQSNEMEKQAIPAVTKEEPSNSEVPRQEQPAITHHGKLIVDATACPQDISYPTDLNLLNDAREKSEELIDELQANLTTAKPRTYREIARKKYLKTAQKKKKTKKEIRNAISQQLQYLKRNISSIHKLLEQYDKIPLQKKQYKYLLVIQTLYDQQKYMYDKKYIV